jgi:glucose dehydrogenase
MRRPAFSPLKQITPSNVSQLQPAWIFDTPFVNLRPASQCQLPTKNR